jgi:hypothetical protein
MSRYKIFNFCNNCELKKDFLICSECYICLCNDCVNISDHNYCEKCDDTITCGSDSICYDCKICHYNMITDLVAVGDCESSYNEFDIIVNLFGEDNGCNINDIILKESNGKKIYNVKSEYKDNALYLLTSIIPKLYEEKDKKILFHCYAGVSRSSTFAIAYLMIINKLNIDDAYNLVKSKREIIQPNKGFLKTLIEFNKLILMNNL